MNSSFSKTEKNICREQWNDNYLQKLVDRRHEWANVLAHWGIRKITSTNIMSYRYRAFYNVKQVRNGLSCKKGGCTHSCVPTREYDALMSAPSMLCAATPKQFRDFVEISYAERTMATVRARHQSRRNSNKQKLNSIGSCFCCHFATANTNKSNEEKTKKTRLASNWELAASSVGSITGADVVMIQCWNFVFFVTRIVCLAAIH